MTFQELKATQAEIVAAYTRAPNDGWTEVSLNELRGIHQILTDDLSSAEKRGDGRSYADVKMQLVDAAKALSLVERGARAFMAKWEGMLQFAATKVSVSE